MTHTAQINLMVSLLVSVILIGGGAFAKNADHLRRIVKFRGIKVTDPAGLETARSVVRGNRSSEMHRLGLVNALAIRLPTGKAHQALASLRSHRDVEEVYNDPMSRADGAICIDPAPPPKLRELPLGTVDDQRARSPSALARSAGNRGDGGRPGYRH